MAYFFTKSTINGKIVKKNIRIFSFLKKNALGYKMSALAPASSSGSALVQSFGYLGNSHSTKADYLLKITPEQLSKEGFNHKPWSEYFEKSFYPQHLARLDDVLRQISNPTRKQIALANKRDFEYRYQKLLEAVKVLPYNKKRWEKIPTKEIEKVSLNTEHIIATLCSYEEGDGDLGNELTIPPLDQERVVTRHLLHLFLNRLSLDLTPNNDFLVIKGAERSFLATKILGTWTAIGQIDLANPNLSVRFWPIERRNISTGAVLIKGEKLFFNTPFISVQFEISLRDCLEHQNDPKTFQFVSGQTNLTTKTIHCSGKPIHENKGNAIQFEEITGANVPSNRRGFHQIGQFDEAIDPKQKKYVQLATQMLQKKWIEDMRTNQSKGQLIYEYTLLLPRPGLEEYKRVINVLSLALEQPEENALLIEYIAEVCDFDYSEQEIFNARISAGEALLLAPSPTEDDASKAQESAAPLAAMPSASEQKNVEEISLSAAAMGHAVMQSLKRERHELKKQVRERQNQEKPKPAAQQPKNRSNLAATGPSSAPAKKNLLLSKEELFAKLSNPEELVGMDEDLRNQEIEILAGNRLTSKREEDKFFFDMITYLEKSSGSKRKIGNKGGSHHSIKLIKKPDAAGKNAFSLGLGTQVNRHGIDANGGSSIGTQQRRLIKIHSLFDPLSQPETPALNIELNALLA